MVVYINGVTITSPETENSIMIVTRGGTQPLVDS